MQQTVDYTNNRVLPATVELLIRERCKGKSLRQLGQMFNRSGERVRKVLAKYGPPQVRLLSEDRVAAKLGYPPWWLARLRKEGVINPIRPGGHWLYSEEQVRQLPSLIAEARRCQRCGKQRPPGSVRFCTECSQYKEKHRYLFQSPEAQARQRERCQAWQKANPEKVRKIRSRANKKYWAKRFERASYVVSRCHYLPLGTIVKVKATYPSPNGIVAILNTGFEIPFSCLRVVKDE